MVEVWRHGDALYVLLVVLAPDADESGRQVAPERRDRRGRAALYLLRPRLTASLDAPDRPVPGLTPRQNEVMALVAEGLSDGQIARRLGLAESTVRKRLEQVYARTGAHSRAQALQFCAAASPGSGND